MGIVLRRGQRNETGERLLNHIACSPALYPSQSLYRLPDSINVVVNLIPFIAGKAHLTISVFKVNGNATVVRFSVIRIR
jgi:hypothetical protein